MFEVGRNLPFALSIISKIRSDEFCITFAAKSGKKKLPLCRTIKKRLWKRNYFC